jgi:hypothetical protein
MPRWYICFVMKQLEDRRQALNRNPYRNPSTISPTREKRYLRTDHLHSSRTDPISHPPPSLPTTQYRDPCLVPNHPFLPAIAFVARNGVHNQSKVTWSSFFIIHSSIIFSISQENHKGKKIGITALSIYQQPQLRLQSITTTPPSLLQDFITTSIPHQTTTSITQHNLKPQPPTQSPPSHNLQHKPQAHLPPKSPSPPSPHTPKPQKWSNKTT